MALKIGVAGLLLGTALLVLARFHAAQSTEVEPGHHRSVVSFDQNGSEQEPYTAAASEPIQPLPRFMALDKAKVALGERLFGEAALSQDGTVACASCHGLGTAGVDRLPVSVGIGGRRGGVNAPTVFNAGLNFRQFWDGRAKDLYAQVGGPLTNPAEMGSSWPQVVEKLQDDPSYAGAFAEIYADGITAENVQDAIVTFEQSLITPDSRFDRFLRGDEEAIDEQEKAGYQMFKSYGCASCHQGMNVGGNLFEKVGLFGDYFADRGNVNPADFGRFNVTGREADRYVFRVPGLRNVALTAPYFHDGTVATLEQAVRTMAKYQLGRNLPEGDVALLVRFLRTLTGQYRGRLLE